MKRTPSQPLSLTALANILEIQISLLQNGVGTARRAVQGVNNIRNAAFPLQSRCGQDCYCLVH